MRRNIYHKAGKQRKCYLGIVTLEDWYQMMPDWQENKAWRGRKLENTQSISVVAFSHKPEEGGVHPIQQSASGVRHGSSKRATVPDS